MKLQHVFSSLILVMTFTLIFLVFLINSNRLLYYYLSSHFALKFSEVGKVGSEFEKRDSRTSEFEKIGADLCHVSGITPWRQGVVTQLQPRIGHNCNVMIGRVLSNSVRKEIRRWKNNETDEQYMERMLNASCEHIRGQFSNNFYVSQEELDFPIAYAFVIHSRPVQVVRFLKAIYRAHNLYCIHVDAKSSPKFVSFFAKLSSCLDNLFVASKLVKVFYKHASTLEAQLNCLEDLVRFDETRWKYVINVVGTELPLKTNREVVWSLKNMENRSLIDGHLIEPRFFRDRFTRKCVIDKTGKAQRGRAIVGPIPYNITVYKGSTHFAATRKFVEFILTNEKAVEFRKYMQDVWMPEECFYGSLYHLPESTDYGGYQEGMVIKPRVVENVWSWTDPPKECTGKVIHGVCIITSSDLNLVYKYGLRGHFFFNKYFLEEDPVVMDCAEERLVQLNIKEFVLDCEPQ